MRKKEDLRVIKTKRNLYDGLIKMMKDRSFEDIKVSDICNISLINRSTFYDHFNDKYELLSSLIEDLNKELALKLEENKNIKSSKDYYMNIISLLFDHISENIDIYTSIIKNNDNSIARDMFYDTLVKDVYKNLEKDNHIKSDIPTEIITIFYVSAVINVCILYVKEPKKYKKEDILKYLNELVPNNIY